MMPELFRFLTCLTLCIADVYPAYEFNVCAKYITRSTSLTPLCYSCGHIDDGKSMMRRFDSVSHEW